MVGRGDLTDQQWQRLEPLLPAQKPKTGRPGKDHRTVINGILWVLRTGAPWRDLPERYDPWRTAATRFYRWRQLGLWDRCSASTISAGSVDYSCRFTSCARPRCCATPVR